MIGSTEIYFHAAFPEPGQKHHLHTTPTRIAEGFLHATL